VGEARTPSIYSIAAHRGFADALVAGLVPRYSDPEFGLARLTLLLPSSRAARTVSEAFVRLTGESGDAGLLMPRLVTIGDLDLDEVLGSLLDPLGASDIPPAVEPTRRWFELSEILRDKMGEEAPSTAGLLRLARELAGTMDRVLAEDIPPQDLVGDRVLDMLGSLSEHWIRSLHLFLGVQDEWFKRLQARGEVDVAPRRNMLFDRAATKWRASPPQAPIVAAGVTSAAPALAKLLRSVADLPNGAVILPDLDLAIDEQAWAELGQAGASKVPGGEVYGRNDALTHPQYHLKLLLNRMDVRREEVQPWHRRGSAAADPKRSKAISSLFLPPKASKVWVDLPADERRLSGVRMLSAATVEEEAQAIALLVREALETPAKRVAVITPDRALARRVVQHLKRWNIEADDTAGRALSQTAAGRLFALLAELVSDRLRPVTVAAALGHPLVRQGEDRGAWLSKFRTFERRLRGPSPAPGLDHLSQIAAAAGQQDWWADVEPILAPLWIEDRDISLATALNVLAEAAEALAGDNVWAREDGRALSALVEDMRLHAGQIELMIARKDLATVLREAMDEVAVRPPYGGHPRVSIYGLLESRGARADLVICGGLNEGGWPQTPSPDSLLAPGVLRAIGVPGTEFRIGLSAHDLAGAMGAPEVILSRSLRDGDGPTIASRFLLRVEALLGELGQRHREETISAIAPLLDRDAPRGESYVQPRPNPAPDLRNVPLKVTALDRLLGDPYQFYASEILKLRSLESLEADPFSDPRLRGTLAHEILEIWHEGRRDKPELDIASVADDCLRKANAHPLLWGLWRPRLISALERFADWVRAGEAEGRVVAAAEIDGSMTRKGVRIYGRADRIDRLGDGTFAIVDYKTGTPPSAAQVEAGFALQLGLLGLIVQNGEFNLDGSPLTGEASEFEYWSMAKKVGEFGYVDVPMKVGSKRTGLPPDEFLPHHEGKLDEAIDRFIKGSDPFAAKENPAYPGYTEYDQLMRLEEWAISGTEDEGS